jgi:hypothetical protein
MNPCYRIILGLIALLASRAAMGDEKSSVSEARRDEQGFLIHIVDSPYQAKSKAMQAVVKDFVTEAISKTVVESIGTE